jgi:UDP-2,3-diacylglucosamine pyrophosphatase LpxH
MEFNFQEGNLTDNIRAALSKYNNPKAKDFRTIAEQIGTTAGYVKGVHYRDKQKTIKVEIEGGESWEVKNGKYVWETKHGLINLPVEFIDQLFFEYSSKGRNYTSRRICNKHNLKPWEFNSIKLRLQLYKDSNVFSPYTWDNTPLSEREAMVAAKIRLKLEDTGHVLLEQHENEILKAYKLEISKGSKSKFFGDELKAQLLDHLPTIEKFRIARIPEPYKTDCIVVTITDLHIGAKVEGLRATKDYNNEILRGYLKRTAELVNQHGAKEVYVNILGDLIESFTGLNHPNSWKSMQYGMYGVTVVKEAHSILLEFLCSINNLAQVNGVGGNHDRPTASNKEESNGEIAELIFWVLEKSMPTIKFTYNHTLNAQVIDGLNYILVHGDKAHSKDNKIGTLVFNHGKQDMFNLVLAGHLHSRITGCDSGMYRKLTAPSIFTGNSYSDDLGFNGNAGFLISYRLGQYPVTIDYTI